MKLHTLALIAALAISSASVSIAQTAQPGNAGAAGATGTAPTTPPTHPTERGTPSTMTPGNAQGAKGQSMDSKTEAMQTCKNMSSTAEQEACMKKAKKDMSQSKSKPGDMNKGGTSDAAAENNGSGTGYSRPASKP